MATTFLPSQYQMDVLLIYRLHLRKKVLKHFSQMLKDVLHVFVELDVEEKETLRSSQDLNVGTYSAEYASWGSSGELNCVYGCIQSILCSNARAPVVQLIRASG